MTLARYAAIKAEATAQGLSTNGFEVQGAQWTDRFGVLRTKTVYVVDTPRDTAFLGAGNTRDQVGSVLVPEAIIHLMSVNQWIAINNTPSALNLKTRLDAGLFEEIDMADSNVMSDINASPLTPTEVTAFIALGDNRRTLFEVLGLGEVKQRDLGRMRIESDKGLI